MIKEKIIVFGRGEYYKRKKYNLDKKYEIVAFLDNSVDLDKADVEDMKSVYNPSCLKSLPELKVYCISKDFISMWDQLIHIGIAEDRIHFGYEIEPLQEGVEQLAFSHGEELHSMDNKLFLVSHLYKDRELKSDEDLKAYIRERLEQDNSDIDLVKRLCNRPVSKLFGSERGKAVDRKYIEIFLGENKGYIKGTVLEVLNNKYTKMFGGDKVDKSVVSHVNGWGSNTVLCNFETGEGVTEETYDCIICTQTLQYIYDVRTAVKNLYTMLKTGGTVLITVPGIKPICEYDDSHWGEYWSFTVKSVERLIDEVCGLQNATISSCGNVKTATAYMYGICVEELEEFDFKYNDARYPFIITAKIIKKR